MSTAHGSGDAPEQAAPAPPADGPRRPSRLRRVTSHPLAHLVAAIAVLALLQAFVVKPFTVPSESMENTLQVGDRVLVDRTAYLPLRSEHGPAQGDVVAFRADETLWGEGSGGAEDSGVIESAKHLVKLILGDTLGFGPTTEPQLVKRVIATEGQTVSCCSPRGGVLVDGAELPEPYIKDDFPFEEGVLDCTTSPRSLRCVDEVKVPAGMLLALGDHRGNSSDGASACRTPNAQSPPECMRWVRTDDVLGRAWTVFWPLGRFGSVS
ncbi:signal peptidase I [Brachybacterium massiliense]|uniref:signal peptidase I n=1 Tax=Brachybacterium massiliense TaxID=1755098 RepID=UPI000B3BC7B5|nr:signal peptidase I [Brachybacterium massiliense]